MTRLITCLLLAALVAGCASMTRLNSYGARMSDARVHVGRAGFAIWVHPVDDTIVVQERLGGALAGAIGEGLTFNAIDTSPADVVSRHAAAAYLGHFGCRVVDSWRLEDISYEVRFACPDGVRPGRLRINGKRAPFCAIGNPFDADAKPELAEGRCPS